MGAGFWAFNPSEANQFVEKGVPIYRKVLSKDAEQHQNVTFTYQVNGKQYTGVGHAGRGNPDFNQIQIGEEVVVYYNSENPEKAILGYPQLYSGGNYNGVLFTAIVLPIFPLIVTIIILLLHWKSTRKVEGESN